jgi:hypothetical protein
LPLFGLLDWNSDLRLLNGNCGRHAQGLDRSQCHAREGVLAVVEIVSIVVAVAVWQGFPAIVVVIVTVRGASRVRVIRLKTKELVQGDYKVITAELEAKQRHHASGNHPRPKDCVSDFTASFHAQGHPYSFPCSDC